MRSLARLDNVAKIYPRVHRPGERLRAFGAILAGREPREGAEVLSDVSLEVFRGQSLGIIGENGAGKSTLLKVLTGVIQPSRGQVQLNARAAALLELGAGFQPEFSGLDNVRMKASILGMSKAELDQKLDDILEFADIGDYIHEPVKHYSSGMVVRLGFAVVTASQPELLITDEVLAVGDESFQKKCVQWIQAFLNGGGTLLLVSHSIYLVQKLCQRALWLHEGRAREYGEVDPVTQHYLAWHERRSAEEKMHRENAEGQSGQYRVAAAELSGVPGSGPENPAIDGSMRVSFRLYSPDERPPVCLVGIFRADGTPIYGVSSDAENVAGVAEDGNHFRFQIEFRNLPLLPGQYQLQIHAMDPEALRVCNTRELAFHVEGKSREFGFVHLAHRWLRDEPASD